MADETVQASAPASPKRTKSKANLKPRLSVPITDDGQIAFDSLTPKVRERLRRVAADPELRVRLDLAPADDAPSSAPAAPAAPVGWDAGVIGRLYDLIGYSMMKWANGRGFTPAQQEVLLFTPDEKAQLVPSTGAVLDKYLPGGLDRWGPEFVLGATLLTIGIAKIEALQQLAPARDNVSQFPQSAAGSSLPS